MRTFLLTAATLVCFAANSLLTRAALGAGRLDAATFTLVRLLTGALTLSLLARVRPRPVATERGSWPAALYLAGYAVCFTLAYTRIGAGVGALVLFGSVQVTMIGVGLARGERPARIDWLGLALALAGLLVFELPGATAPDAIGTTLMVLAGASWGLYSLRGRASRDPLGATAGNFVRATTAGVVFAIVAASTRHLTADGLALAAASGAIASGLGYTIWYTVLPALAAWRAAIVQLVVPILTALAASAMLHERVSMRLVVATVLIALGVALTAAPALHRRRTRAAA